MTKKKKITLNSPDPGGRKSATSWKMQSRPQTGEMWKTDSDQGAFSGPKTGRRDVKGKKIDRDFSERVEEYLDKYSPWRITTHIHTPPTIPVDELPGFGRLFLKSGKRWAMIRVACQHWAFKPYTDCRHKCEEKARG